MQGGVEIPQEQDDHATNTDLGLGFKEMVAHNPIPIEHDEHTAALRQQNHPEWATAPTAFK
jgi:hypothetical protein